MGLFRNVRFWRVIELLFDTHDTTIATQLPRDSCTAAAIGRPADDAKRLKDLERENTTLKRLLADAELEKAALKEIARGNF